MILQVVLMDYFTLSGWFLASLHPPPPHSLATNDGAVVIWGTYMFGCVLLLHFHICQGLKVCYVSEDSVGSVEKMPGEGPVHQERWGGYSRATRRRRSEPYRMTFSTQVMSRMTPRGPCTHSWCLSWCCLVLLSFPSMFCSPTLVLSGGENPLALK